MNTTTIKIIIGAVLLVGATAAILMLPSKTEQTPESTNSTETAESEETTENGMLVSLYFYNESRDRELTGGERLDCSEAAVLPVSRTVDLGNTPIQNSINLLLEGQLTAAERAEGFSTEFPNPDFELLGANLVDGTLTLEFSEVPGFTSGGACRVSILSNQIIKTAKQFPEVDEVRFIPAELFQP